MLYFSRKTILGFVFWLVLSSVPVLASAGPCKNVLIYYTSWSKYNSPAYNFSSIPYSEITHISYAFITPNPDGSLSVPTDYMGADGVHYDGVSMVAAAHAAGVKVLLSCGGAGSTVDGNYTTLASSTTTINTFAANLLAYCQANHFDGVDIDWEFPNTTAKSTEFDSLLAGIRAQMPASQWLLTAALSADSYEPTFLNISTLNTYLSFFNLMTYDYHGSWLTHSGDVAPLFEDSQDPQYSHTASGVTAVNYYLSNGASASKINYGIPFYGYGFTTAALYQNCGGNCTTTTLTYAQIAPLIGSSWTRAWDSSSDSPSLIYSGGASVITYDDSQSVSIKASYVLNTLGVAGIFAWSADQDYNGTTQPILDTMSQVASSGCGPTSTPTKTPTFTFTPTPVVASTWRVNAGGPNYTDSLGNLWAADTNFSGGTAATATGSVTGTADPTLYASQRYGASFSYVFHVPAGSYQATLKFAETYSGDYAVGDRVFNVSINSSPALTNFDIYAQAGGDKADDQVFNNIAPSGGLITIQFTGTASTDANAVVEALQIIPEPSTPTFTPTNTFSFTPSRTPTSTATPKPSATFTSSSTFTSTASVTPSRTPTASATSTASLTPTITSTTALTKTPTATNTVSLTPARTFTLTPTGTPTSTAIFTFSSTWTTTQTETPIFTLTSTPTVSPTLSLTLTNTPMATLSPSGTPTSISTATSSFTPVFSHTFTPTTTPTFTTSLTATPTVTLTPTFTIVFTPSSTATGTFTTTATLSFTSTPTPVWTATWTLTSTLSPTVSATRTATLSPSATPPRKGGPVVYPNPFTGFGPVHLHVPFSGAADVQVELFTAAFRMVQQKSYTNWPSGTDLPLVLTDKEGMALADGVYYWVVQAQGNRWTVKFLILR